MTSAVSHHDRNPTWWDQLNPDPDPREPADLPDSNLPGSVTTQDREDFLEAQRVYNQATAIQTTAPKPPCRCVIL